ncbi:hypothetical protein AB5I41_18145 [Sphingomonas sp. MMS24-JH45]
MMTDAIGAHFFHRWKGWWGTAAAFSQRYRGGEPLPVRICRPSRRSCRHPPGSAFRRSRRCLRRSSRRATSTAGRRWCRCRPRPCRRGATCPNSPSSIAAIGQAAALTG